MKCLVARVNEVSYYQSWSSFIKLSDGRKSPLLCTVAFSTSWSNGRLCLLLCRTPCSAIAVNAFAAFHQPFGFPPQLLGKVNTPLLRINRWRRAKERQEKGMEMYVEYHHKCHEIERQWLKVKCELMEQKMGLMTDRGELQKKTQEQKQLQQKYEKVYVEVKELRKLKYAADRKSKGPVGVAR